MMLGRIRENLAVLEEEKKTSLKGGRQAIHKLMKLDPLARLPFAHSEVSFADKSSIQTELSLNTGYTIDPRTSSQMHRVSKYREYHLRWYIKSKKTIITEVFREEAKLDIILPEVQADVRGIVDFRKMSRAIYVLNFDSSSDSEKELCVVIST